MSCRVPWHYHPKWVLEEHNPYELSIPFSCSWTLIAASRPIQRIYPGIPLGKGKYPMGGITDNQSPLFMEDPLCRSRVVVAPVWSIVVQWDHRRWGFLNGSGQGQPPPVFCQGAPTINYKAICIWLLLVLCLEVPRQNQNVNLGWLQVAQGLGPHSLMYRDWGFPEVRCCLFEKI